MHRKIFAGAFIGLFGLASLSGTSQTIVKWEAGLHAGAYIYQGDLVTSRAGSLKTATPGIGVFVGRAITPSVTLRAGLNLFSLKGDDLEYTDGTDFRRFRAFKFRSKMIEASLLGQWMFLGNPDSRQLNPYLVGGAGVVRVNTTRDVSAFDATYFAERGEPVPELLAMDQAAEPQRTVLVLPVGAGARFALNDAVSISLEGLYRYANTDYIDGYSLSANPKTKDQYYSATAGLVFRFGGGKSGIGCPGNVY